MKGLWYLRLSAELSEGPSNSDLGSRTKTSNIVQLEVITSCNRHALRVCLFMALGWGDTY